MIKQLEYFLKYSAAILSITFPLHGNAIEVVRANFSYQSGIHPVDISLFDITSPVTVTNFLGYVDDGSYNKLIINRSITDFILQAGGFTYDPLLNDGTFSYSGNNVFDGGLQQVINKGEITNEFRLPNKKGTLAMAKKPGQSNSASNEWFINLADNDFLDSNNGGFAVFGEVLGSGMDTLAPLSYIPVFDISSEIDITDSFVSIPLLDFQASSSAIDITESNLIKLKDFERLFYITDTVDVGDAAVGTNTQRSIEIRNNNSIPLQINTTDLLNLSLPFSLLSNTCNTTLLINETCSIDILFSPTSTGYFANSFVVKFLNYTYEIPVLIKTPSPEIYPLPEVADFGIQPLYTESQGLPEQKIIRISNRGNRVLNISNIVFESSFSNEFEFIDNCTANSAHPPGTVPPDSFCILIINFKPKSLSEKSASISVFSDDPVRPKISINVSGGASSDTDGIADSIEDGAPNQGDGNLDGIPDRLQSNVASFVNFDGTYTTLLADRTTSFVNVEAVSILDNNDVPEDIRFDKGLFKFGIEEVSAGNTIEVGLILSESEIPASIYSYSATLDNNQAHWNPLEDGKIPGTIIFGNVNLQGSSMGVTKSLTSIRLVDGKTGDSDIQVNNRIVFTGGPEISISNSSSGSMSLLSLITFCCLYLCRKERTSRKWFSMYPGN